MDMSALAGSMADDIAELRGRLDLLEARHAVGAGKRGPVDLSGMPREVDDARTEEAARRVRLQLPR
jgi:RIO kinase 1